MSEFHDTHPLVNEIGEALRVGGLTHGAATRAARAIFALTERRAPDHESAWCIEAPGPLFWNGGRCDGFGTIEDAVRFARKEDAEHVLAGALCRCDNLIVTGHAWVRG